MGRVPRAGRCAAWRPGNEICVVGGAVPVQAALALAAVATAGLLAVLALAPRAVRGRVPVEAVLALAPGGLPVVP